MKTDLDALERVVGEMTAGEWCRTGAGFYHGRYLLGNTCGTERAVENAAGIVALRNAAESLIGELRLARKVTQIAGYMRDYDCEGCPNKPFPECRQIEVEDIVTSCSLGPLFAALAAYQTGVEEGTDA